MRRSLSRFFHATKVAKSTSELVSLTTRDQIAILTLKDPSRMNALSEEMGNQFLAKIQELKKVDSSILSLSRSHDSSFYSFPQGYFKE